MAISPENQGGINYEAVKALNLLNRDRTLEVQYQERSMELVGIAYALAASGTVTREKYGLIPLYESQHFYETEKVAIGSSGSEICLKQVGYGRDIESVGLFSSIGKKKPEPIASFSKNGVSLGWSNVRPTVVQLEFIATLLSAIDERAPKQDNSKTVMSRFMLQNSEIVTALTQVVGGEMVDASPTDVFAIKIAEGLERASLIREGAVGGAINLGGAADVDPIGLDLRQ